MTELRLDSIELPGSPLGPQNPLPYFRERKVNLQVPVRETVQPENRKYFGNGSGKRVLPYRMQDQYTRNRKPMTTQVAILENRYLKATFWIEYGCRMMSLIYKPLQRELLFNNPVFQPANLALRNAWFSGGVEWNVGQVGHTFFTCSPLFVARINGLEGESGLRFYEYERCKNLFWHTDIYLPANSQFLIAFTRVVNAQDDETTLYWWTNIAIPENPGVRILSPTDQVLYHDREIKGFGQGQIPYLPTYHGRDATYPVNASHSNEFFFQCKDTNDVPWEAALDRNGEGLIEASTPQLNVRKLFCWGMNPGGRHWQEFLSVPGNAYTEIQAGLAPTQLHSLPFKAGESRCWTEIFGFIKADPTKVHSTDWDIAWHEVDKQLKAHINAVELAEIEEKCLLKADLPSYDLLQLGSGWGALELARKDLYKNGFHVPDTFVFPSTTIGAEQHKWIQLLYENIFPEQDPEQIPGDWMVQREWRDILQKYIENETNENWYALLHYGVMQAEAFNDSTATGAWLASITNKPSLWAYRNLAVLSHAAGKTAEATGYYQKSLEIALISHQIPPALIQEYLSLLIEIGEFNQAWKICESLPDKILDYDPVQILIAQIALKMGFLDHVDMALNREYASIREGAVILTEMWFELWRRRMANQSGQNPDEICDKEIENLYPPPSSLDFRMA